MKKSVVLVLILAAAAFSSVKSLAQTITSTALGGTWSTGSTWVGGVAPAAGQNAVIATLGSNSVNISADMSLTTGTLQVNNGANLTISNNTVDVTVGGLTVNSGGTYTNNGGVLTVNGPTNISGTLNLTGTARANVFNGDVTLNSGGVWSSTVNNTPTITGSFTNNATTFTPGAGVHTFNKASGGTISGSTITSIPSITFATSYTNNGTLVSSTALTVNAGIVLTNNGTITASTALSGGTGTLTQGTTGVLNIGGTSGIGTLTASAVGNTVNYTGAAQTCKVATYYNLTLSGTANKTFATTPTVTGVLSMEGTTATIIVSGGVPLAVTYGANATLRYSKTAAFVSTAAEWITPFAATGGVIIAGTGAITAHAALILDPGVPFTILSGASFSTGGNASFTFTVGGITTVSGTFILQTNAAKTFTGDVTINSGATWNETGNGGVTLGGNFVNNTALFTANTGVHTFSGATKTLSGSAPTAIPSVTFSGAYTNNGTLTSSTAIVVNPGVTLTNNGTITSSTALNGATGTLTQGATGVLNIGGTSAINTLTATASGNTVNYTGGAQTLKNTPYYNLGLSAAATSSKTFPVSVLTISGNLAISGSAQALLNNGITHSAASLSLGGVNQPSGTHGFGAPATYQNTTYFTNTTGVVNVSSCSSTSSVWLGTTSSNWHTAANWCGGVPTSSSDVTIRSGAGVTNQPTISAAAVCNSMTINSGATLTITGSNTLSVGGNWTNNGNNIVANTSTVTFDGASTIGGTTATTFYNVSLNGSSATTAAAVTVGGNLTVSDGATLTVGGFAFTVTGTTTIGSGASGGLVISSATGAKAFTGLVTLAAGATWTNTAANSPVSFNGGITNGGTFNAGTGLHTFNVTQSLTGTLSIPSITVAAGTLTNNNTLTVATALSGTGLTQALNATLNLGGTSGITTLTATSNGNTVNYTGAAQSVHTGNYHHLTLSGSGTVVLPLGMTAIGGNLTMSNNVTTTTVVGLTITGNLSMSNTAALNVAGFNLTVTGTTTVGAGAAASLNFITSNANTKIFTGLVTIATGATWANTINSPVTFRGGITNSGTFTAGTGLYTFDTNAQALTGTLSIANVTVATIALTNNNTFTVATALGGSSGGGLTQGSNATLNIGGTSLIPAMTATASGNTVNYTGAAQTVHSNNYYHLTLSGTGTVVLPVGMTAIGGNLTMSNTAATTTVVGLVITGNLSMSNTAALNVAGFNLTVTGTTTVGAGAAASLNFITSNAGTKIFTGLVTIATAATWTNTAINSPVTFRGGITNSGTFNSGTGVYTFDTNSQTLTGTLTITNATVTGITLINNGTLTVGTSGTGAGGIIGTGGLTQGTSSTLNIGGVCTITTLNATTNVNTVNYNASAAQSIKAINYSTLLLGGTSPKTHAAGTTIISGNLTLSGSVTFTPIAALTIGGTFTLSAGSTATFTGGSFTHNIAGNWVHNAGNFTSAGTTINFNGTTAQSVSGAVAPNLTFNNVSLTGSNTVTFNVRTVIGANLSISATAKANFNTVNTHTTVTLTLGGAGTVNGTWGAAGAANNNTAYFAGTGFITVGSSSCSATNITWTGAGANNNWTNVANWCGGVPSSTSNVFIPAGTPRIPNVDAAASCKDITINSGATLTTGAFTLTVSGNWSNSGTFNAGTTGTVAFNGTSPTLGGSATSTTFNNITLSTLTSTNLTVNSDITVNGAITWTTNGLMVIASTADVTMGTTAAAVITSPTSARYIQTDESTAAKGNLIAIYNATGTFANWATAYPIGSSSTHGGYTPVTIGGLTNAPSLGATLKIKAIYNSDNQGQLRRVFRMVVPTNGTSNTNFTTATFNYHTTLDLSSGDALSNYSTIWYFGSTAATPAWTSTPGTNGGAGSFTVNAITNNLIIGASSIPGTYYYTIGSSDAYPNTWYSYQSGVWSDYRNWTTDPSGSTRVNGLQLYPQPGDAVVILNGRTITNDINSQVLSSTTINNGGTLDMSTATSNNLGAVSGAGTLRINGVNFPSGTYTSFVSTSGGTVEFYNTGGTLPNLPLVSGTPTYNKLKLTNSTSSNITFLQLGNLTVNGTFDLTTTGSGTVTWQINDATAAQRTIIFNGDLTVASGGRITVGTGNEGVLGNGVQGTPEHALTMFGNFTNNGIVQFYDATDPELVLGSYNIGLQGNAVRVTFTGPTDNTITCNNTTDFYRLVMNKGTGQQALLTINASAASNFRLYGPTNLGSQGNSGTVNEYSDNAISIVNGTLQLTGFATISSMAFPTPVAANDYYSIPQSGALWLNGPNVSVRVADNNTGNGDQRLMLNGMVRVTNGTLNAGDSKGIGSDDGGAFWQEGGTVNCWMFRPRQAGTGIFSFTMAGGVFNIGHLYAAGGGVDSGGYFRFDLNSPNSTFAMSGGTINVGNVSADGAIQILSSSANYSVTGGTVNIYAGVTANIPYINTTAPFYNLTITEEAATALSTQLQTNNLVVLNDLIISTTTSSSFTTNNLALTVGGNFDIQSGATFTPGTSIITFNGASTQTWTLNGTTTSLATVVVNKASGTLTLAGSNTLPNITGGLTLTSGTFADAGKIITVSGTATLSNSATHSGTGVIDYTSTSSTIGGTGGTFGNLNISTNATVATSGTQTITGTLRLVSANSTLNIGANSLVVNGNIYSDLSTGVAFTATKRIITNGFHNAGGLTRQGAAGNLLFPVGTGSIYTPNTIQVTATTHGTITVRPVNSEHPNVAATTQSVRYYWRVTSLNYAGITAVTHKFYDYSTATEDNPTTSYRAARYDRSGNTWATNNSTFSASASPAIPNFSTGTNWTGVTGDQLDGEYTCGNASAFVTPVTFYSITNGPWDQNSTWSTNPTLKHAGAAGSSNPTLCASCPVEIGDGVTYFHTVSTVAASSCGALALNTGSTLDCKTFTGHNFGTNTGGAVTGRGVLRISSAVATGAFPAGDFSNFIGTTGGTVEWYTTGAVNYTLPTIGPAPQLLSLTNYYDLDINPLATFTITLPPADLNIYHNFTVGSKATYTGFALTNGARTIAVTNNLAVTLGTFNFSNAPSSATAITVGGTTSVSSVASMAVVAGGTANTNTISTSGDFTNDGIVNFNNTGVVNLTFTGSNTVTFGGAVSGSTTLNLVTVNKGSSQTPTVNFSAGGTITANTSEWLTLSNGTFNWNNASAITISSSSSVYSIPTTAKLKASLGTVNVLTSSSAAADLNLNGALEVAGGTMNIGNSANTTDNDIEYASAGTPSIIVSSGTLFVNGSIRRSIFTITGALVYNQTGGSVTVAGKQSVNTRGVFEIDYNTGSNFTLTGTGSLTIQRQTGGTGYADVFINPVTSNVSSTSTLAVGLATGVTQANLRVSITPSIGNFTVLGPGANANPQTVTLYSNPMILGGSLTITTPSILNTSNLDVSIAGDLATSGTGTGVNSGTYNGGTNTTTFNGITNQTALLTSPSTFTNMTINNTGSVGNSTVTLSNSSSVPNLTNLNILSGTLDVNNLALTVNGNIINNSSQTATGGGGSITFTTTTSSSHTITSSNGSFTNLKIGGLTATTANLVSVSGNMTINGYLDFVSTTASRYLFIGSNLLTFTSAATVSNAGTSTFIKTNGVSSDLGVKKDWALSTTSFIYAVGTRTNYTPITMGTAGNLMSITAPGSFTIVPVDSRHPTASPSSSVPLLNYYWKVSKDGALTHAATGRIIFQVPTGLVGGGAGTPVGAYLNVPTLTGWTVGGAIDNTTVPTLTTLTFTGSLNTVLPGLNGRFDYTYGTSPTTLPNPITPVYSRFGDTFPTNTTTVADLNTGGTWDAASSWTISSTGYGAPFGLPAGRPVAILSGARINLDDQSETAFTTQLAGLLMVSTTGHNIGTVSGTGTLRSNVSNLPAGTYTAFTNAGGGTIEYEVTALNTPLTMSPTESTYNNLSIAAGSVGTLATTASALIINGNITVPVSTVLDATSNPSMTVAGIWTNAGTFNAGASSTLSITGNLVNSGTYNLATPSSLTLASDLINTGTFNSATSSNFFLAGNLDNSTGTFNQTTGKVTFNGASAQNIFGVTTFNDLTINKSANNLTLNTTANVDGLLTMTAGKIISNNYQTSPLVTPLLILDASATTTGGSSASFVSGQMRKIMLATTTSFTFPVGSNSASRYRDVTISNPTVDDTWDVTYIPNNPTVDLFPNMTYNTSNMRKVSAYEYWQVANTNGSSAGLTLSFDVGSYGGSDIGILGNMKTARWNGTQWDIPPGGGTFTQSGNNVKGYVSVSIQSAFSPQTLATDDANSTLPVELLSFTANLIDSSVELDWSTASELNNDYFTIERASDIEHFEEVAKIKGKGTFNSKSNYSVVDDSPLPGVSYYRLKQADLDGNFTYSELRKIENFDVKVRLRIYPNPVVDNKFTFELTGVDPGAEVPLKIVNLQGGSVFEASYKADQSGSVKTSVELAPVSSGMYIAIINAATGLRKKIVIP